MNVWVCRAGRNSVYHSRFIENNKIFLTWDKWKIDLRLLPPEKDRLRAFVCDECCDTNRTAVSNHLSQVMIFRDKMSVGDWVIVPGTRSREYSLGVIKGDYSYHPDAGEHFYHQREVEWKLLDVPRSSFSKSMQYSLGAYRTIFSLKNTGEFFKFINNSGGSE